MPRGEYREPLKLKKSHADLGEFLGRSSLSMSHDPIRQHFSGLLGSFCCHGIWHPCLSQSFLLDPRHGLQGMANMAMVKASHSRHSKRHGHFGFRQKSDFYLFWEALKRAFKIGIVHLCMLRNNQIAKERVYTFWNFLNFALALHLFMPCVYTLRQMRLICSKTTDTRSLYKVQLKKAGKFCPWPPQGSCSWPSR